MASAVLLMLSGIILMIIALVNVELPGDALWNVCDTGVGIRTCYDDGRAVDIRNKCMRSVKASAFGCTCPGTETVDHSLCDCAGTEFARVKHYWSVVMILIGVLGFLICAITAAFACVSTTKPHGGFGSVYWFSGFGGFFTLFFAAIGCFFVIAAVLIVGNGTNIAALSDGCEAALSNGVNSSPQERCAVTSGCELIAFVKDRTELLGFGLGIPFLIASICMCIGCWSCCCCKSHFIDEGVPVPMYAPQQYAAKFMTPAPVAMVAQQPMAYVPFRQPEAYRMPVQGQLQPAEYVYEQPMPTMDHHHYPMHQHYGGSIDDQPMMPMEDQYYTGYPQILSGVGAGSYPAPGSAPRMYPAY